MVNLKIFQQLICMYTIGLPIHHSSPVYVLTRMCNEIPCPIVLNMNIKRRCRSTPNHAGTFGPTQLGKISSILGGHLAWILRKVAKFSLVRAPIVGFISSLIIE